jgi:hypothetical protein
MSSGEADVVTFTVNSNSTYPIDGEWYKNTSSYNNMSWSYTSPVYYYQITCPKCRHLNWAEVDKIITCKGETTARNNRTVACKAKIKAVLEQVDYEIPVTKP